VTGDLLVLALWTAVNPTMFAFTLVALELPRTRLLLGAYLATGLVISIACGLALARGAAHLVSGHGSHARLSPSIDLGVGIVLLVVALLVATGRLRDPHRHGERQGESRSMRALRRSGVGIAALIGIAAGMPGVVYLVAVKDVAAVRWSLATDAIVLLAFNLVMFAPAIVPLIMGPSVPRGRGRSSTASTRGRVAICARSWRSRRGAPVSAWRSSAHCACRSRPVP